MDITNLRENYPKLISHLNNAHYNKAYVSKFNSEIKHILRLAASDKLSCYADVYREYERAGSSKHKLREKRSVIGQIEQFDLFGQYPDGTRKQTLLPRGAYYLLCPEYKAIIDDYISAAANSGKKDSTINSESEKTAVFLLKLQQSGVVDLADANEGNVLAVFVAPDGRPTRRTYRNAIATVLMTSVSAYPNCEKVVAFLPVFRKNRNNIQYLTDEEIAKTKKSLTGDITSLKLRDKAIGMLVLYTGLRRCDIASMTLDAIDWEKDTLNIRQQKTEMPLTLPLSAIVGNALYDYIKMERPESECNYVFLSQNRPFGRMKSGSMAQVAAKIMKAADIRQDFGDRQGFHIFRHHLATKLLGNGVSRPVISSLIGHASPESLDTYLSADFPHLKECAMSVERFPMAQEVLEI